ncbi:MAG: diguanylate cyclase [Halanaerobiales bacterium]|nr:diguanylate cyclase [Halanaerobiales bacterium]
MSLRKKTFIILVLTITLLFVSLFIYSKVILLKSFVILEEESIQHNVKRVIKALERDIHFLDTTAIDYAFWDDTYTFVQDRNDDYLQSYKNDFAFLQMNINFVVLTNSFDQIIFEKGYNLDNQDESQIFKSIRKYIDENNHLLRYSNPLSGVKGIVMLPEGPMLVSSRPILTSELEGPVSGSLILARLLDGEEIRRLSEETQVSFTLNSWADPKLTEEDLKARSALSVTGDIYIQGYDDKSVNGYTMLEDIYGKPILLLKVNMPRVIYQKGHFSIHTFVIILAVSSSIIVAVSLIILERIVLARIKNLSELVNDIGDSGDLNARIPVKGNDELSSLAGFINEMIEALFHFQVNEERYLKLVNELKTAHQQVTDIIDFLPDATFVIDTTGKVIAWNKSIEEMTGVRKEEIIGKGNHEYDIPFYGYHRSQLVDSIITNNQETEKKYQSIKRIGNQVSGEFFAPFLNDGRGANLWCAASPLYDSEGNLIGAIESIRDITDRKKAEEQQKYLSLHDPVTGLYNRTYFENEMLNYENEDGKSLGIILCDVDGLKVINDSMGHQIGDKLLKTVAEVLKKSLSVGGVVVRIGGDEFAILFSKTDQNSIEKVCHQIKETIKKYNEINPQVPLSLSLGYAIGYDQSVSISGLFKEADDNMYRDKLYHIKSKQSAIVQTLMKALEVRDYITEGHADRLEALLAEVGRAIGLSEQKITDLRLLGQFHDLGKVGIPDRILFKEGPLTSEEYSEMKRHSEIGYRIARSAPELIPISELILKHHEWWNGKGYPLGLKGEEIPLECRLLAIADAYDAMVNDRPYRKAMSHEQAIAELREYAGEQFDPNIVEEFIKILEEK